MRRLAFPLGAVLVIAAAGVGGVGAHRCSHWRDEYKRFLYSEMLKNSPVIYSPQDIDRIVGDRPLGCARPTAVSDEDTSRYRREHVGPNEFLDEVRDASARLSPAGRLASRTPFVVGLSSQWAKP